MTLATVRTALATAIKTTATAMSRTFASSYNWVPSDKAPRTPALVLQWKGTTVERLTVATLGDHRTNRATHRIDAMVVLGGAGQVPALEADRDAYVNVLCEGLTQYSTLSGAAVDVVIGEIKPAGFQWEDATVYGLSVEVSVVENF